MKRRLWLGVVILLAIFTISHLALGLSMWDTDYSVLHLTTAFVCAVTFCLVADRIGLG